VSGGPLAAAAPITWDDFLKVDVRVGRIVAVEPFPEARNPAYKLRLDFGELGERRSSAQITTRYRAEELVGRLVVAVVNFPPKRIAGFLSEVLVLGVYAAEGDVVLLRPDQDVAPGHRVA
jgi:tRNA-binding protein